MQNKILFILAEDQKRILYDFGVIGNKKKKLEINDQTQ